MADPIDLEGRVAFVKSLPRKVAELRATLGTLVADPRSQRMRDELRRRLHAVYTLTRSYNLPTLSEGLREGIAHLDAVRGASVLTQRDLETFADLIATLPALAQRDMPEHPEIFLRPRDRGPGSVALLPPSADKLRPRLPTAPAPGTTQSPNPPAASSSLSVPGDPPPHKTMVRDTPSVPPQVAPGAPASSAAKPALSNAPLGVLVVGHAGLAAEVKRVVPPEAEVSAVRTLAEAVTAARDMSPDVVVAESAVPADGLGLLAALRGDPLTDFLPVVLLVAPSDRVDAEVALAQGATEILSLPASPDALRGAIERAAQGISAHSLPPPDFGELTLEQLTQTLQEEIRRGILGAAGPRSSSAKLSLGHGSEVLAATWEAIARVREVVEKKSRGRVRFEGPAAPLGLGGAHVLSIGDDDDVPAEDLSPSDDPLPSRTALVVDDDPGVVWFFAGLLREAGMAVVECTDGEQALRDARRVRPDVVISDILMPGLDGFALCRAIRRDVSLRHTPVILLSWKEDLLVRMRELGAQAQGFLRKESRGEAVLARVRAVLRPRVRMLRRIETLAEGAELRGRVERVGVFTLLEVAARALRDATLTVTDSYSVTELELREGALVSIVRTAQDGSLSRGEGALLQVLGTSSARFAIRRAEHAVRPNVAGELGTLLMDGAALISALEDSVSGAALLEVASIDLDGEAALAYARSLPEGMRSLIERIVRGESPRNLVLRDGIAPAELEPVLVELARRGVIRSVRGAEGQDLVAPRYAVARGGESLRPSERAPITVSGTLPAVLQVPPHAQQPSTESLGEESVAARAHDQARIQHDQEAGGDAQGVRTSPAASPPVTSARARQWTPPSTIDEAARPGFGLETETDTLAGAVLRELSEAPADEASAQVTGGSGAAAPEDKGTAQDDHATQGSAAANVDRSSEPITDKVAPENPAGDKGAHAADAGISTAVVRSESSAQGTKVTEARSAQGDGDSQGGVEQPEDTPEIETEEARISLPPEVIEKAAQTAPGLPLEGVPLDARGLPRRRSAEVDLPPIEGEAFEAHEPVRKPPSVDGSAPSIIVDPALVGAPVEVSEAPPRKHGARGGDTSPVGHRAIRSEHESNLRGTLWYVVTAIVLGALSFFGVRHYLRSRMPPAGQDEGVRGGASGAPAESDAEVGSAPVESDVAQAALANSQALGAAQSGSADAGASAGIIAAADASVFATDAASALPSYVDPAPFLDGGTLDHGRGMLVLESAGPGSVEVTLDSQRVGHTPLTLRLREGTYQLDYLSANGETVRRITRVRAGRALRLVLE